MIPMLVSREVGLNEPAFFRRKKKMERAVSVELNCGKKMEQVFNSGLNSIDIERQDGRYLISAGSESKVAIYDIAKTKESGDFVCKAIASIDRSQSGSHKYSIETVQWYPRDNGMFLTSSLDKSLKVWDSNMLQVAEEFNFPHVIYSHHMSSKHCLAAVACDASAIQICDLRTGTATQTLQGHKKAVLSVRWSPRSDYILASGSKDNRIFIWDVRKASGYLVSLDQNNCDAASRSNSNTKAHNGDVNSLCFTDDGLNLLSYGTDDSLRLWEVATGENSLVNFGKLFNDRKKSVQIAVSGYLSHDVVYVPSDKDIIILEIFTGKILAKLAGHYDSVTCCCCETNYQEVYSGASDANLLVWSPRCPTKSTSSYKRDFNATDEEADDQDVDAWSNDEE